MSNPLRRISSGEDREAAVAHDRDVPHVGDDHGVRPGIADDLGIDRGGEIGALQDAHRDVGKHTLREHHDPIVTNARFLFVAEHAISRLLRLPGQDVGIPCSEFGRRMIAAVYRERVFLGVFLEEPDNVRRAAAPVPWDERNVGRETVTHHQSQELLKVDEPVSGLQQGIINYQARVDFGSLPAGLGKGPSHIEDDRDGGKKVLANVEVVRGQLAVHVDDAG
jgi:hypothetical protein